METIHSILASNPSDITPEAADMAYEILNLIPENNIELNQIESERVVDCINEIGKVRSSSNVSKIMKYI